MFHDDLRTTPELDWLLFTGLQSFLLPLQRLMMSIIHCLDSFNFPLDAVPQVRKNINRRAALSRISNFILISQQSSQSYRQLVLAIISSCDVKNVINHLGRQNEAWIICFAESLLAIFNVNPSISFSQYDHFTIGAVSWVFLYSNFEWLQPFIKQYV